MFGSSLISKGVAYLHNEPKECTSAAARIIAPRVVRCRYATSGVYASAYQEWRKPDGSHAS